MKIGDRCFVHGYVDEIRKDTVIIRNRGGYFGTDPGEVITVNDTAHPNWISVKDKLPDTNVDVLLQFKSNMGVGFWEDGDWGISTGDGIFSRIGYDEEKPIAWMPLPEPYQEDEASMSQLCKDCPHFHIRCEYENAYNWGLAECSKYNLITDFRSKKKFETLECVAVDGKKQEDRK